MSYKNDELPYTTKFITYKKQTNLSQLEYLTENLSKHNGNQLICFFFIVFLFLLIHNRKFHNQNIIKRTYQNII